MRRFYLHRKEDPTGMSGTGRVADGVEFENGQVALTWKKEFPSVTVFQSISTVEKLHTHGGKDPTRIVWVDDIREDIEATAEELRSALKAEEEAEEAAAQALKEQEEVTLPDVEGKEEEWREPPNTGKPETVESDSE